MSKKILYILTPSDNISPFDVTLASDAGFDQVVPITGIDVNNIVPLVQDSIFCRPPGRFNDTGIFLGGRDVQLAKDMLDLASNAMVGPFQVGVFADPNGAYTTAGSVVALVEKALKEQSNAGLAGKTVSVFGTGPVGLSIAILTAQHGAKTKLCQLTAEDDPKTASRFAERYNVDIKWVSAQTFREKNRIVKDTEVIICAAKAGVRILDIDVMQHAERLLVAADTNAVPPSGIAHVDANDNGAKEGVNGKPFWSIGSLAIGDIKYKTQYGLFEQIQKSAEVAILDFPDAFAYASNLLEVLDKKDKAA